MVKKFILKIILTLILVGCDYTPIYSTNDGQFNIEVSSYEGDREINSKILSKFRMHKNPNSELIQIKFNSTYQKSDVSKNLAGKAEEYLLEATTNYTIITSNLEKNFIIQESFKMKNFEDDFEERNYEQRIKENIANINYERVILQIKKIK
mgnify:CR=1 FL=1|tara:strand:- start:281 stop:733 length:453 start_codon:yes stop_codon:yes gene_type:complete